MVPVLCMCLYFLCHILWPEVLVTFWWRWCSCTAPCSICVFAQARPTMPCIRLVMYACPDTVSRHYGSPDTGVLMLAAKYCLLAADSIKCWLISNFLYLDIYSFDLTEVNDIQALRAGSGMCQHWGLHCIMPYKAVSQLDLVLDTHVTCWVMQTPFLFYFFGFFLLYILMQTSWMHPGDDKVARIATMSHTRDKSQTTNEVVQQQRSTENNTK